MTTYNLKRVYESASSNDGRRVLVDRVWPRGMTKEQVKADQWLKEIAPSTELRQWFGHDPAKFLEFKKRYSQELTDNPVFVRAKKEWQELNKVTLLYSAKDEEHNQAIVIKEQL